MKTEKMHIKKGTTAINIVTDRKLEVTKDCKKEIGENIKLSNNRTYQIVSFISETMIYVSPVRQPV